MQHLKLSLHADHSSPNTESCLPGMQQQHNTNQLHLHLLA
jgi:hypothetical protein